MGLIEEKIKTIILVRYKSLRNFVNCSGVGLPYTTVDGMLKRGIYNANIQNVLSLCNALQISSDELAKGNIVPISASDPVQQYAVMLSKLSPSARESAIQYIKYLAEKGDEE